MTSLRDQVQNAIYNYENPNGAATYQLSYAQGISGYSFGNTQGDLSVNGAARATFADVLNNTTDITGLSSAQITKILDSVKNSGTNDVVSTYMTQISSALNSSYGHSQVDAYDSAQVTKDYNGVQSLLSAASANGVGAGVLGDGATQDTTAIAELSMYVNQFGSYNVLKSYLSGNEVVVNGHTLELTGPITREDLETFFGDTKYFSSHSSQYDNFLDRAATSGSQVTPNVPTGPAGSGTITFSEYPVGTADPTYKFTGETVTINGQIVEDGAQPASPAAAANTSYTGPVFIKFSQPVSHVDFNAGYFDDIGSTTVSFIGAGGKVIASSANNAYGIVHYSQDYAGGISAINIVNTGYDESGFSVDTVNFSGSTVNTPIKSAFSITGAGSVVIPGDPVYTFTVTRSGDVSSAASVGYGVVAAGGNPVSVTDFPNAIYPVGEVDFAEGQSSQNITVDVLGDYATTNPKTFAVALLAPSDGSNIATGLASATTLQPPSISNVPANESVGVGSSIKPFSGLTITDPNADAAETATVSLSSASNGVLSNLGGGSFDATSGTYSDVGSLIDITADLNGLTFTPTGGAGSIGASNSLVVTLTIGNSSDATASESITLAIKSAAGNPIFGTTDPHSFGTVTTDPHSAGGEVYALYEGLLGRAPDPLSLESLANALNTGTSLHDLTGAMLSMPEVQQHLNATDNVGFVEELYETVLGRQSDANGANGWITQLNAGVSRVDVADSFVFSSEHIADIQPAFSVGIFVPDLHTSDVARLYYAMLDRAPDAGGLQGFTSGVENGVASLRDVAQAVINSPEYDSHTGALSNSAYVQNIYEQVLGRQADAGGLQGWTDVLAQGASRASLVTAVVDSSEFQGHYVNQSNAAYAEALYEHVLGRQGDAAGLQGWVNALNNNVESRIDLANIFVNSAEFQTHLSQLGGGLSDSTFVESLYEGALGRQAEAGGLQLFTSALAHGTLRADVAVAIAESPEAHQHLVSQIEQGWHLA